MSGSYDLWVYWGRRGDDARTCAHRLATMLTGLQTIHLTFERWFHKGYSLAQSFRPFCTIPPDLDALAAIFEKGRFMTDVRPRRPIPELGYSVGAWNGRNEEDGVSFHLMVGSTSDHKVFANTINISLEAGSLSVDNFDNVLRAVVLAWDADWATLSDWNYENPIKDPPEGAPRPPFNSGWMTYLSARFADKVTPPPGVIVEAVQGGGVILLATKEMFDIANPAHTAVADAIQTALTPIQGLVGRR